MSHDVGTPPDQVTSETAPPANPGHDSGLLWGVGAVALRLGIATPTLRTWERRYGLGPRQRTDGGHRRYSEDDIRRVQLMGRLVNSGVPAQSAAKVAQSLDTEALRSALVAPRYFGANPLRPGSTPQDAVTRILDAALAHDPIGLSATFADVLHDWGVTTAWTTVMVPALQVIGERWSDGSLGVESEHLASERLATELRALVRSHQPVRAGRHPIVLATAADEQHALPLLAVEASLAGRGIAAHSLGNRVPSDALIEVVRRLQPAAVFVWASLDASALDDRLVRGKASRRPLDLVLGGPGWGAQDLAGSKRVTVTQVHDLESTVDRLTELFGDLG